MMTTAHALAPETYARTGDDDNVRNAAFDATVTPGAPAAPILVIAVFTTLCAGAIVSSLLFAKAGAWPVILFFALDVMLVLFAFRLIFRRAGYRERIVITKDEVILTKRGPSGREARWRLPRMWTRLIYRPEDHANGQLAFALHNGRVQFAACLAPKERAALAARLESVLKGAAGP